MATAPDLVTLSNGEQLARGVYNAYLELAAEARKAGFNVWVSSGYRTHAKQVQIFTDRFRQQATGSGRFNDVRYWDGSRYGYPGGTRWVRVSPLGTVAVPGTSLHEKASAVDFGNIPAGGATAYARWMRANAPRFGFSPTGYRFNEAWHYDYTGNPWAGSGSNPFPTPEEEMLTPEQDARLKLIEAALVTFPGNGTAQYKVDDVMSKLTNVHTRVDQTWDEAHSAAFRIRGFDANLDMLQLILQEVKAGAEIEIDYDLLADKIAEKLPEGTLTAGEVARATRDLFHAEPLTGSLQ